MASYLIHLAICCILERALPIKDVNAFRIGHILPDALKTAENCDFNSHYTKSLNEGKQKCIDFAEFYDRKRESVMTDEMYLGYYFHLIQDNLFRSFLYSDLGLLSKRGSEEFLNDLYNDYHILNGQLVKKYFLAPNFSVPDNFPPNWNGWGDGTVNCLFDRSDLERALEAVEIQFKENISGTPVYLNEKKVDEFIINASIPCVEEYRALKEGKHRYTKYDLAFNIVPQE